MDQTAHQRPHWRLSLAARLAIVWAVLLGAAVGASSWIAHHDARQRLLSGLRQGIERDASEIQLRLETWMQALQEDAVSSSRSPLVSEFLNSLGTADEQRWRLLLENEFRAVFAGKPTYFQMRLLSARGDGAGQELLRLDRKGGELEITPRERLQEKANRLYFREALATPPDRIYLSRVDLNRDFGAITSPHIPTIRAAVKIGHDGGDAAILIINTDLRPLFGEIDRLASPGAEVRLLDADNDCFLLHPDPASTFATDLQHGIRPSTELPALDVAGGDPGELHWLDQQPRRSPQDLTVYGAIPTSGWPARNLGLIVTLPEQAWHPEIAQFQWRGIWVTALAALAGAGVAILVSLPFTSRLRHLSSALRHFDAGDNSTLPLPDARSDEVGIAIERFREMAQKVREQVEELKIVGAEAQEASATKEAFLATMSHEIRTPMNSIVGLIRALEANDPPSHQGPILNSLRSSATNLVTLLNTVLDHTRLREGTMQYECEEFDAARLVREVGQSLTPSALAKRLEMQIAVPDSLFVRGDAVRLRQVLNNLVNNAVKFTSEGQVTISLAHHDGQLECRVADTGPGIEPAEHENIFAPFVSLQSGDSHLVPGAGLGLSVSKEIVEQQGGELSVDSHPGQGSTFSLRLPYPRCGGAQASSRPRGGRRPVLRKNLRLLYVEDVLSNQEVMQLILGPAGIELICVRTAGEALERIRQEPFDLVMVDLQLPDMPGDELARRILGSHPDLPLIAVTAQSSARSDRRLTEAGIRAVMIKPFTEDEAFSLIAEHTRFQFAGTLMALHPANPSRANKLAAAIAVELRAASRELQNLKHEADRQRWRKGIDQIQHKLKTTIVRFEMDDLGASLEQLAEDQTPDPDLVDAAVTLLEAAADDLQSWSGAQRH